MASLNKVQLIGNLGQDPELRYSSTGAPVVTISVATTERWKDKAGEKRERTEWHRVEAWGHQAKYIGEFARKGSSLYIEGSLATDRFVDNAGVERLSTKVKALSVQLLDRRDNAAVGETARAEPAEA